MLLGGGGVILFTASTNALVGYRYYADYNATKAGLLRAHEVAGAGMGFHPVRVNAVCPGYVLTPMQEAEYTPEMLEEVNRRIPLGRHATPRSSPASSPTSPPTRPPTSPAPCS